MTVSTRFDIGETVYVLNMRRGNPEYVLGNVDRFTVVKINGKCEIRYQIKYYDGETWCVLYSWEKDLIRDQENAKREAVE